MTPKPLSHDDQRSHTATPRRVARCALGALAALALGFVPTALAAKTTTKAQHTACERRAARTHRRPHCPHTTIKPATAPKIQNPYANYHAPTGPLLTADAATAIAVAGAKTDGEAAPAVISVALATIGQEQVGAPAAAIPPSPGYTAYLADQIYVVIMRGHFTLNNAQLANGATAPTGTLLQIDVEAHTGQIISTRLKNS
jgi:hypothetical protein